MQKSRLLGKVDNVSKLVNVLDDPNAVTEKCTVRRGRWGSQKVNSIVFQLDFAPEKMRSLEVENTAGKREYIRKKKCVVFKHLVESTYK